MTTATELSALRASFEAFLKNYEATTTEATLERKEMMSAISNLAKGQDKLAADMAEVKPVTTMVMGIRAKIAGMAILVGFIGSLALLAAQFFKEALLRWMGW